MNIINRFTFQTLMKNKVRTAVTIIGILLSTAMFTAVTSIIVSMQQYMIDLEIDVSGAWHGRFSGLPQEYAEKLTKRDQITDSTVIQNVGYAKLEGCINEDKPYLCIESITSHFTDFSPVKLAEGRMPENNSELVISQHLSSNGNITYKVGDTLTIDVGKREAGEGNILGQNVSYSGEAEKLTNTISKTYHVVGICERPDFEARSAPGYTAFTTEEGQTAYSYDVLFQMKDPTKIDRFENRFFDKLPAEAAENVEYSVHSELLRTMGQSPNGNYMSMLNGMGTILIGIIVIASISLIYNAFSISVSERTKQFGLLKSIGATKKQIRKSVIFEAFFLCLIGIPSGIGCGLLGIGITLHFVGELMTSTGMINTNNSIPFELTISWWAILIAAAIALVTVLISAMLPARRAIKMPAIEALRESNEVKLRQKNIRSSKFVYRLFGFEGMLANKNFKRNRRKYRLTVASLSLSVILFLSASSFSGYIGTTTDYVESNTIHDISFFAKRDELGNNDLPSVKRNLKQEKHVDEAAYSKCARGIAMADTDCLNPDYLKLMEKIATVRYDDAKKKVLLDTLLYYVDDSTYKKYLEEQKLNVSDFTNTASLRPLIWDKVSGVTEDSTLYTMNMLSGKNFSGDVYCLNINRKDNLEFTGKIVDVANLTLSFVEVPEEEGESELKEINLPKEKALTDIPLSGSQTITGKLPLGVSDNRWQHVLTFVFPYSAIDDLPKDLEDWSRTQFYIQAKEHKKATSELENLFKNNPDYSNSVASHISDIKASEETEQALASIINIFSYGFITLITLIVVANVFNTISTNVQLRRREFAMLKSVGMTRKGFNRMMNYECILYGVKGLLFGLPVSFVLCYMMYKSMANGLDISFMVPWLSVLIVVVSVFVIVFASMLYSMSKIKKDNPIEALRNDNL